MTKKKKTVERSKYKRYRVPKGVYVGVRPDYEKVGQIIDISMEGLAFSYLPTKKRSNRPSELDIFLSGDNFRLEKVPFETVSDFVLNEVPFSGIRRCSVRFRDLTDSQRSQLDYFIQNHTLGEV